MKLVVLSCTAMKYTARVLNTSARPPSNAFLGIFQGSAYNRPFQVVQAAREDVMGREGERDQARRPEGPITGEYMKLEKQRGFKGQADGRCVCTCCMCCLRIKQLFLPNDISTTSTRPDSASLERHKFCGH